VKNSSPDAWSGDGNTQTILDNKPCHFVRSDGGELDRLRNENLRLREIFDSATLEFTSLHDQIQDLAHELELKRDESKYLAAECAGLKKKLEKSEARANKFATMLFAVKSEKLKVADIGVGENSVVVESTYAQVVSEGATPVVSSSTDGKSVPVTPEVPKAKRGARHGHVGSGRKIPENLPVEEVRVEIQAPDLNCPTCGGQAVEISGLGEPSYQVTVKKQYILRKIIRVAYKPACSCGSLPTIFTAPPPAKLILKSKFSTEFWVDILISKFMSHLPVNRQLFEMVQAGVDIEAGTVFNGLKKIYTNFLTPLSDAMILELRLAEHWHADETRWRMFLAECKTLWYMWGYRSKDIVLFVLDPTRAAAVPLKTLFNLDIKETEISGLEMDAEPVEIATEQKKIMNVDRYSAYKTLMRLGLVLLAYCWAHARRDFTDLKKKYPTNSILCEWADVWLLKIANLYHINNERVKHPKDGKIFLEYDTRLRAAIQDMRKDIDDKCPHDAQTKVMASMIAHWEGLTLFVAHLELPMDNNLMENAIRGCALGRNNFLGNHSKWGGNLAACMYSVVKTCLLNNIDPKAYLTYYFNDCMKRKAPMDAEAARKILPHKLDPQIKELLKLKKN